MRIWIKRGSDSAEGGIWLRCANGMDGRLRCFFLDFVKWLRSRYAFPVRVNVYLKNTEQIRAMDGEYVSAVIFTPFDRSGTPFIKIAVGDFYALREKHGEFNALCSTVSSLAHELTHYYQWLSGEEKSEVCEERQARYYARKKVYEYLEERGYDFGDKINRSEKI